MGGETGEACLDVVGIMSGVYTPGCLSDMGFIPTGRTLHLTVQVTVRKNAGQGYTPYRLRMGSDILSESFHPSPTNPNLGEPS